MIKLKIDVDIKREFLKYLLNEKNIFTGRIYFPFNFEKQFRILSKALLNKGFNLLPYDNQHLYFKISGEVFDIEFYGVDIGSTDNKYYQFGICYDFNDFTEDIESIYVIDPNGGNDIMTI